MKKYQESLDILVETFNKVEQLLELDKIETLKTQFDQCMVMPNQMLYVILYNPLSVIYNRNVKRFLMLNHNEVSADDIMENYYPDDAEFVTRAVKDCFEFYRSFPGNSKHILFSIEHRIKRKDDYVLKVQRNTRVLELAGNRYPLATVSVVTDITPLYGNIFNPRAVISDFVTKEQYYYKTKEITLDYPISARELEVLELLCKGLSSKEISEKLFISRHTVDGHRRKLLEKTNKSSTTELVSFALTHQIIDD